MESENRKFTRRDIDLVVHIDTLDGTIIDAEMLDLSQGGVRLKVGNSDNLPEQFLLQLSATIHRWSRIAWRSNDEIGVEFVSVPQEPVVPHESIESRRKCPVVIKCPRTGRGLPTGILLTTAEDLSKLPNVRRFTQCPSCKAVHGWMPSEASLHSNL
jgi:hypothetical protein